MLKHYWISAYSQYGEQFGACISANDEEDLIYLFSLEYPDCEVADYGVMEEEDLCQEVEEENLLYKFL